MDFIPDRLLRGIAGNKRVVPNATGHRAPTTTLVLNNAKITHALGKLAQAGVADDAASGILNLPTTTSTVHAEKITHGIEKLTNAGLASDSTAPTTISSSHGLATKYIVVIAVVSAVILLVLLASGCLCWRRYRRRRAYDVVSKGIDKKGKTPMREKEDMFNADMGESESFNVDGQRLTERNFESGYDKVDTEYEGTGYGGVDKHGGDKRARLEA
ncbi:hypothetical protein A1O7_07629 [Cladophialophora yegresii CBS 114405]|uniref:Mid2 domain-containing protein n=1 Tax=Cladophialophora yegresii CBS 114405 TaxID=1182544 RepID=W9VNJ3_9EURO|nr:uncharacterized protein A1O7_07629 [Cladophialophora yegresii CBS 114405]EXJ57282.1 hypothetical protein A1O7_07629 [Cladophialophora yegresii CBS 114405]